MLKTFPKVLKPVMIRLFWSKRIKKHVQLLIRSSDSIFFPTTFMCWVSFSSAPDCVDPDCWTTPFSTPPRPQERGYCCFSKITFSFLRLFFWKPTFTTQRYFEYSLPTVFSHNIYVLGLLFFRPIVFISIRNVF